MIRTRRVDFLENDADFGVALMASLGFSNQYISQETGLTLSQVQYRATKALITRGDYRNGNSRIAKSILSTARQEMTTETERVVKVESMVARDLERKGVCGKNVRARVADKHGVHTVKRMRMVG